MGGRPPKTVSQVLLEPTWAKLSENVQTINKDFSISYRITSSSSKIGLQDLGRMTCNMYRFVPYELCLKEIKVAQIKSNSMTYR